MPVSFDEGVELLRAAGEPSRLRILALLRREELAVQELTQLLCQSQPRVSRHLKLLADAGLVERFRDGAWVFYRLADAEAPRAFVAAVLGAVAANDSRLASDRDRLREVADARARRAAAYFAANADHWDQIRAFQTSEGAVEAAIVALVGEAPVRRLIDLGSGAGRMLTLLGGRAATALGLDLSGQMLNIARGRTAAAALGACELRHGDVLGTGLADGEGDLVVVHQVLHYLTDPPAAVAEAARLTAPGGRLVIVDFAPHQLEFLRADHQHRRLGFADGEIDRWLRAGDLEPVDPVALPPAEPGGLTVKIWSARRAPAAPRVVA
ncbi:MAG: metalloregulator ArsR/SmtB family transcription factor [Caulobacteraceae bacterium]